MRKTFSIIAIFGCFGVYSQGSYDLNFRRGYYYLEVDNTKALEFLTNAIQLDSSQADAYYYRGIANYKLQNLQNAIADFDQALSKDSTIVNANIFKAFAYRALRKMDMAIKSFTDYLSVNENDTVAYSYFVRGKMKQDIGDYKGAIEDFNKAIAKEPLQEKYLYYLFLSKYYDKKYKSALTDINNIININPQFYGYYLYRGNVFYELRDYKSAEKDFDRSLILNNHNADAYYKRGLTRDSLQLLNKALQDYDFAIRLKPEDPAFHAARGNLKYKLGNKEGACLDWTIAGELGYYKDFEKMKRLCR